MLDFLCKEHKGRYGIPRIPMRGSVMLYGLFVLLLCTTQVWGGCTSPCPTGCTCIQVSSKSCTINCSKAGLSGVPGQADLPGSGNHIKVFDLSDNNITSIGANDLSFLTNLEELYLQGNNINSIHSNAFHDTSDLITINLSDNPIATLEDDLFKKTKKFETVNLSHTQLSTLPDDLFQDVKCLKNLDLSWNNFSIVIDVFKTLRCLEVVKLRGNAFATVGSIQLDFNELKNLVELDISHNKFTTFQTNVLSSLSSLQKLNIANNPFDCTCDLLSFRNELVTLETSRNVEFEDRNDVNCSNAPSVNLLDQASERFWSCQHSIQRRALASYISQGPGRLGSCYFDAEDKVKYDVLFTNTETATDNQTCIEKCFDNNSTFGIFEDSLCMCGYKHIDSSNECWCASKAYVDGSNMACVDSTSTNIVYVSTVYPISAGLTIVPFDRVTAGQSQTFTAEVQLSTIVQYIWSFGDSSESTSGTSSSMTYTNSHTYATAGTYTMTVMACTTNSACASLSVLVEVRPLFSSDSIDITCPSSSPSLSSTITVTGTISAGYNTEYKWTKLPTDNVTAITEGQCEATWDFFRGRCLQALLSSYTYSGATSTCNGGHLLTIHYTQEITDVLSQYSSFSTILLGATKDGNGYKWTNGNKAYFMAADVTDSSVGGCVVIDRTSGALKGIDCSSSHSILCQEVPNTECFDGGHYYSDNNHCYKLYETNVNWSVAASNCQLLTNQSQLAVIDSLSLKTFIITYVFGSVTQSAWIGLTDKVSESYLMWTNNQSVVNYNPVGTAPETDCITVDKTGSWSHYSCQESKYYICQYSLRETVKIPTYLAGIGRLVSTGSTYSLTSIASTSLPANTVSITNTFPVNAFVGLWFSHGGEIQQWNFRTNALTKDTVISFQVYTPICSSGTLIKPGCDGNGARYASCSTTVTTCSATPYCNEGKESCYHTNDCIPVSDPCNCNQLDTTTYPYCSTPFVGDQPKYRLVGQTVVNLPSGPAGYFSVNADGLKVSEGDIIAFQTNNSVDVILCDNTDLTLLQNILQKIQGAWVSVGDEVDMSSSASPWRNNTACYFQAVYTIPETVTLPPSLQYSTVAGSYTYELSLPNDNIAKSCTFTVEEEVGDFDWIYPIVQSTSGGTSTFYVEADVQTYLVFAAKRGTNLQVSWSVDGNDYTSTFQSSCPSSVTSEVGTACDSSNYWISEPFAYVQYTFSYNSGTSVPVIITVNNTVGSSTQTFASQAFQPLSLDFNLTDFSNGYLVEINKAIDFTTSVGSGNPTNFEYFVNGTKVHTSTSSGTFTYTFTAKNYYEVSVEISDGFKTANKSISVTSKYAANVQSLTLVGVPTTAAVSTAVQFQITCTVNAQAYVTVQWEFESGTVSESLETTTTSLTLSKSHTHTINGTYTFRLTITDDFGIVATQTQTIRVVEHLPSVSLSASSTSIRTGSSIDFIATVPEIASKDYGTLSYTFDFNDTTTEVSSSKEKIHTFGTAGTYYVTVQVSNQAEIVQDTVIVGVFDTITGLTITADRIVQVSTTTSITASVTTGNALTYSFEISDNALSSGNITDNVYNPSLSKTGHFNITLTAWNDLSSATVTKELYVVDTTTLEIIGFEHNAYQATNTLLAVTVDVLYYDISDLIITWTFDGNLVKGIGGLSTSYTFTTSGIFNFTVVLQSSSNTAVVVSGYSTVEIQDSVAGLIVSNDGPVGLASTGSAVVTVTASTTGGDKLQYTWDTGGTVQTTTSNFITLTKSTEVSETVVVMVWNDVSSQNGTTTYKVQYAVEGLKITCLNCTESSGVTYLQSTKTASFVASLTSGSNVTYNWSFGDGGTGTGISQTHSYISGGTFTITVSGVNDVGTVIATFNITVQEEISSVSINCTNNIKFVNSTFTLQANPVGGSDITYAWQDCGTCLQNYQASDVYITGIYYQSGTYIVSVKAFNQINFAVHSKFITVIDYITNVTVTSDLIQGQYAAKGQAYTFAAVANTDNSHMYYTWKVKTGSTTMYTSTVHTSKNLTYTFTNSLQYEVEIRVWNTLFSEYTATVDVMVEEEITGAYITLDKTSPIATGEVLTVAAVTSTGTELSYKWILQNSTGQYTLNETAKSFTYTFSGKGDYVLILEVSNDLGMETVNKSISVMEAVTGVNISSVVNESYPYIAVGSYITFSAVIGTGESYTTTWTLADGVSSALTFSGVNFTHNFTTSGTFTITVTVQNLVSTDTYSFIVYVQGSIASLTLVTNTSLAETGQSVQFTANYNTGADNLVFEWTIEGTLINGTSDTLSHIFNTAGTFTAHIKVYNHISQMTAVVNVVVEVRISGFSITGCNAVQEINNAVSASFNVSQGTDVTYSYRLDTESSSSITGSGSSISYTFTTTGLYNLYVNATNQVSQESLQCLFTIIGPISGLAVDTSNSNFFVNYTVHLQVTGNNLIGVTYNWRFSPINENITTSDSLLQKIFTTSATYQYELEVSNGISSATITGSFFIVPLHCDTMTVAKGGQSEKIRKKSSTSTFEVTVDKKGCTSYTLKYDWKVYNSSTGCAGTLNNQVTLNSATVTNTPKLMLDSSHDIGSYCVQLTTWYDDTPLIQTIGYNLTVMDSDLIAIIAGGSKLKYPQSDPITVDGSGSFDPDSSSTVLQYSWACSVTYPLDAGLFTTLPTGYTDACATVGTSSSSTVTMTTANLLSGETYTITLTVSASGRTSGNFTQEIEISSSDVPVPILNCITCQSTSSYLVNEGEHLAFTGTCLNCDSTDTKYYEWSVYTLDSSSNRVQLSLTSAMSTTGINSENFVITAGNLPATNSYYIFKLEISKTNTVVTLQGETELILKANSKATGGTCSLLTSTAIDPLIDQVEISCTGYSDPDNANGELNYKVVSHSKDSASADESVVIYYGTLTSPAFYLAPWPGTTRSAVNIKVYVVDEDGTDTLSLDTDVSVSSTVTHGNQLSFVQIHTTTTLINLVNDNNPTALLQYGIALIHEMNEISRQEYASPSYSHVDDRNTVRNRITLSILGLPLETIYQQQQMAFILNHLTKYPREFQTSICQTLVLNEVDILKNDMESQAVQGADKSEFTSGLLLEAVSNNMDAVNAAVYSSVNISNVTSLESNAVSDYKPVISSLDLTTTTASTEDHKQSIITRAFTFGDDIVILNLKTQLPAEDPIVITLDSIKVFGKRTWSDDIEQMYTSEGCVAVLNSEMLGSLYPTKSEVFQIMMVVPQNPFTWGSSGDVELNTKVIAAGFTDTSGNEISVSNIPTGKKPKFIILKNQATVYNMTNSLINSTDYAPQEGLTFASVVVEKGSAKKVVIDTSDGYGGSALHLQIRFVVVANPSATTNATGVIKTFLGKNYEATRSSYETTKEIKVEHMATQADHRLYTLFVDHSEFDTDASYAVTVYNDDPNYDVNISAAIYYSTCQFFDTSANSWDTNGCSPTDESIEKYAVCECEHLTPFGGGMLAPPNTLSFADLVNLDLVNNPVVFVTCSLIFVVYVIAVIICRRLDRSNLERISSIPLCGKDGSFKYEVTVVTGRQPGAGTTANVGLRLYGEYGRTNSKQLDKKWAFQRNCQDTFIMAHDTNLGNIEKLMIWHDNSGLDPSWYLIQVIVKDLQTDHKYYFFANFWMSLEIEKGFIQKELLAAGSSEIQKFGRMFGRAVSNCMADRHLWYSVIDRPAMSRFTRVQRATCVVTILYTFMAINAIWYGLLKQEDNGNVSSFGWEEVVLSLVTNVIAFPFTLIIIWMFKRSKSKNNIFEPAQRVGTAQTIEIDYDPNLAGSFKTNDELISYYDRESTTDSLVESSMTHNHLRRSRTLKMTRQATDDSLTKAVNSIDSGIGSMGASTESKLKRTNNPTLWSKTEVGHKDETYITKTENNTDKKEEMKEVADGILQYLDDVESECMTKEQSVIQKRNSMGGGGGKSTLKRTGTKKNEWKEIDDILNSDNEGKQSRSRPLRKKDSTSTIGSYGKPGSSQSGKGYNPREDPTINGQDRKLPSAGSTFMWANKLRASSSMDSTTIQGTSMPAVEGIGPLEPDMGLAQQSSEGLDREDLLLLEKREDSKSCTLPAWFVYVAYVICFVLCVTSVIMVILYGQTFGADIALQWILALLFCIAMSFIIIEPLKALVIAFYASSVLKKEDTIDDDAIDIQPTVDTSNETVKENKFTPLAGFALLNAKEEGHKILRMRLMLRQFTAYIFYLWLVMTLCYVNFSYDTYLFKTSVDNSIIQPTIPGTEKSFVNMSNVDDFWAWSQSVLVSGLHHRELYTDLEFGTLLGVARMRLVRSVEEPCPATEHPLHSGLDSLTNRTCWGNYGYNEDEINYSEGWNYSQNLSWRYSTGSQTGSKTRYGYVYTYGGGGYVQQLGTTYNDTLTKLQDLQAKNWIDEKTRAIFIDFTMYSAANDLTTVVNLMIEFPLTGGLNTSSDIQSQILLRFVQEVVDPLMVCQCILFLVNIYLVCHIFNAIKDHRKEYFTHPWNWFEMLTTLMAIVINGLYIGCVAEASSTFNDYFNNKNGFTNFEAISDTHVAMRYIQGILIFCLMIKVVKQLRFVKFLYVYERTLSDACGKLAGIAVIFIILFCTFAMAGYLWYGRSIDGFETYWHTLTSLTGMLHGHYSFWKLMDHQPIFSHFFLYFYYAFCYGITMALIISVLTNTYKTTKGQMYFKATMDMQDYEMVEFMMKRFKLWAGLDKPKQGIRRVHFDRRQFSASSRSSRPSSRDSNLSYDPFETNPRTTIKAADRLEATWEDALCTLERVCGLDEKEEQMVKTTQKNIDEWKFQNRIKNYEKELQSWSDKPPKGAPSAVRASKIPRRTSTTGSEAGNSKRGLGTPDSRTTGVRSRPLSDQGGRAQSQPKRTNSRERFSIYNLIKSAKPSKDAWNE
ncbi:polycystin-1-like isoform X1 [Mytilus californianus]|uniref:polycystin-1-like isoform X1 n=2 Tax=Mytilus californianus TaxID=6549 RepID=UPI002245C821|nr:polycystin-1-like isoform X1 [Mytilus californianus]